MDKSATTFGRFAGWDISGSAKTQSNAGPMIDPKLLNAKRRLRIAGGSGVKVAEVNTLMNKFARCKR